jgi:diguanylate cyclase (GGDEF)-like protein
MEKENADSGANLSAILHAAVTSELKSSPLFRELNEDEFKKTAEVLRPVYLKKGETVFNEGDEGGELFILYTGALTAFGRQSDGNQRWLFDIKQRGEFFGEMSIIAHEPRSATISAVEDSSVMALREVDFFRIISRQPLTGFKILKSISIVQNQWLDQSSKSYNDLIRWGETARRRAITDEMTGLYNRRFLAESMKERFSNSSMNFRTMSLLMLDLDKIHGINDRYGFKAGDLVIIAAAEALRSCLRPGDIPARLSGDEFAVLLPDTNKKDAAKVAERIREKIAGCQIEVPEKSVPEKNVVIGTQTSIGISIAPLHAATVDDFVNTSDSALRKAKERGRNRVEVYGEIAENKCVFCLMRINALPTAHDTCS